MNQHWGIPSSNTSTTTTDLISTSTATVIKEESQNIAGEGSNVAGGQSGDTRDLNMAAVKTEPSPATGGTVSAAADSSDNQPPTPTPNENSAYNNQMYPPSGEHAAYHHPAAYNYDQSYHYGSPSAGDYTNVMQQQSQQMYGTGEFKPSARFHPYNTSNTSSSISTSGSISPRVVSSSSPAMMGQNGPPTVPQQDIKCEKCGYVCSSDIQLNEHYATAHTADGVIKEEGNSNSQFSFAPYAIKEEAPQSDILDLDSQKMVYPPDPNDPSIPPMHGMHPMHRPMMGQQWGHNGQPQEIHYMQPTTPSDPHKTFFSPLKQPPQQSPYPPSGMIKPESNHFSPIGTPPYSMPPQTPQQQQKPSYPQNDSVSSSPSEFPSTTTQDGGPQGFGQQRFEPPTSSLPNPPLGKSAATWKSNEARRPKTYNCTACNKWFTSSGHLKRHYNTTLHKNAVKSSNQPDPATMPISIHHHPDRDPNTKHSRPRHHRPPAPPPDPARSPEYGSQFAGQSPGYQQQSQQQNFSNFPQQNLNGHPNGLAGPSVQPNNPSHPRGLLNNLSSEVQSTTTPSSLPVDQQMEQEVHTTTIKREDSYTQLTELEVDSSNNSHSSSNHSLEHHPQLHQPHQHLLSSQQQTAAAQQHQLQHQQQHSPPVHIISHHIFHTNTPQHLSPREDTIHTTQQHNIMDQQQYIISPLGINPTTPTPITQHTGEVQQSGDITTTTSTLQQHNITTTVAPTPIPSFQHLQLPVEHQVNYPTHIIGNGNDLDSFDNDSNHSNSNTPIHLHESHIQNHNTIFSHNSDQNLLQLGTATSSLGSPTTTTYELHHLSSPSEHSSSASMSPVPVYHHQQQQQHHHHHQQQQNHHDQLLHHHSQNQTLFQPITLIENHDDPQQMTHTIINSSHQLHHHITNTDGHILQIIPSATPPMQLHQMDQTDHLTSYHNNIQHQTTNYIHINSLQQQEFMDLQRMSGGVPTYREKLTQPYSPVVPESDNSLLLRISPFSNQRSPQEADMPPSTYTITSAQQQQSHTQYPYSPTISSTQTPPVTKPKRAPKRKRESNNSHMEGGKIMCIECDKEFSKICYLTQHNKTFHNGEQPFRCQKCGKRFPNEELYDTHLSRHVSQDKPFKCDLCPKQFHHKTDLRRHKEAIHTGLKAHVCDLCNKSFCRKDHLRKHIETHSRAKPVRRMKNANANALTTTNNNNFIVINNNRSGVVGLAAAGNTMPQQTISSMFLKNDLVMKEEFEEVDEFICDDEEVLGG